MHVLILQPYLAPYRVGLFHALQRLPDTRLTLLYFSRPERRRQWGRVDDAGLRGLQLRSLAVPIGYERNWTLTNVPHLAALLQREHPDVVVCAPHGEGRWIRLLSRLLRYRIVVWTEQTVVSSAGRQPSRRMQRWFDSAVSAYVVPGRESRECLQRLYGVPDARIHEAPNTVDPERYACTSTQVAARWADPAQPLRVVFVGSLHPRKGVDLLVAAARAVRARCPGLRWELHVAGAGPLAVDPDAGMVLHGHLGADACARLLKSAHLFVLPSRHDCNPLSALEAAHAGLVPLLSDGCGNHPELAPHGWVFARGSQAELERAIETALQTPRPDLQRRAEATRLLARDINHEASAAVFHRVLRDALAVTP
jgi:glycosyltransferase involved in cell wall biosynthesis